MKVLLIGSGRRNQLCLLFKEREIVVHSYELDTQCPISLYCDEVIPGKKWKDDTLKDDLIKLSKDYDLVIPLMDEATKILSELNLDNGCVSDFETTYRCLNKKEFENTNKFLHFKNNKNKNIKKNKKNIREPFPYMYCTCSIRPHPYQFPLTYYLMPLLPSQLLLLYFLLIPVLSFHRRPGEFYDLYLNDKAHPSHQDLNL